MARRRTHFVERVRQVPEREQSTRAQFVDRLVESIPSVVVETPIGRTRPYTASYSTPKRSRRILSSGGGSGGPLPRFKRAVLRDQARKQRDQVRRLRKVCRHF